ncbi:Ig-like domain-containing protein [Massilia agilis]|uniref:Ig-like domain-containing protein n=1 Tax=Massilia agilis TaxID=1811226 RepID=A0ABT2DG42_9BURK|nr:Ig-like domain-containing protein [Massilia agilis]MCS0809391.1 Ig-like domain-containing protein [Massilia agilis]
MNIHFQHNGKRAAVLLLALVLSACGGGGGSPGLTVGTGNGGSGTGSGGTTTAAPTVSVAFVNSSGQATNSLSGANQLTVNATVRDKTGKAVPNAIVTFGTDANLAVFSPAMGTALTDANGVATITMRAASLAAGGAGTVKATSTVAGTTASGEANYSVGSTALSFGALTASPTSIQAYGSTVLSVDVLAGSSKYTDQQVNVSFSSACVTAGKATLASVVATNNGTAQTVYRDQGCGNNDMITVSAAGVVKPATVQLSIAPPAAASVQFVLATPTDQSIVIKGQGGSGRTETAGLKFKVVDIFNHPLAGAAVDFTASTGSVTVNKLSDTTDQNGEVLTTVNSGAVATSFRVKAALHNNPAVYTWSDSIVVTSGLPVQRAFSLSAGKYQVDSTIESSPTAPATNLNVMIADAFGNPVPDGTPVVFQTNIGSVGSSAKGGCLTTNGGCSVDFRMQDPRVATPGLPATPCNAATPDNPRVGVATVCASTTDGTNTVFSKIELFTSSSQVGNVYLDGGTTPLSGTTDLGVVASDKSKVFTLQINDVNNNPMPTGTTIAVVNAVNAAPEAPLPAKVSNITPAGVTSAAPMGSWHTFTIAGKQATGCTKAQEATFSVAVTTPTVTVGTVTLGGQTSYIPFKLTFSCP